MTHDVRNVRMAFVFQGDPLDAGNSLWIGFWNAHEDSREFRAIVHVQLAEWREMLEQIEAVLQQPTMLSAEGVVLRQSVLIPAYLPADLEAWQTTGEMPPGWFQDPGRTVLGQKGT